MLFSFPDKLHGEQTLGVLRFLPLTWIKLDQNNSGPPPGPFSQFA
jgi:hypothetical protein